MSTLQKHFIATNRNMFNDITEFSHIQSAFDEQSTFMAKQQQAGSHLDDPAIADYTQPTLVASPGLNLRKLREIEHQAASVIQRWFRLRLR